MKRSIFEFKGTTPLPAYLWLPEGQVKAVLQITHGMTEHMGRYAGFGGNNFRRQIDKYTPRRFKTAYR